MWPPPSQPGWWTVWEYNRLVARGRADRLAREQAAEQAKRIRRLRRRVERVDEAIVIAMGAAEARQYRRRQLAQHGTGPYEPRSVGPDGLEHFVRPGGRILSVR